MIGILIISHEDLGDSLIKCATHIIDEQFRQVIVLSVFPQDNPDHIVTQALEKINQLNTGDGVLVLSDILGATPCNIASQLIKSGKVECLTGVNLPMLVRALSHQDEPLAVVLEKALNGGKDGVIRIEMDV